MRTLQSVLGIFALAAMLLQGCTKTEVQPEKAEVTEAAEAPAPEVKKVLEPPQSQPAKKTMGDEMYVERARKQLRPENMESELNRIEKELDSMERDLARGEQMLEKNAVKAP